MRISDWSSDVCSSDLSCLRARATASEMPSCSAMSSSLCAGMRLRSLSEYCGKLSGMLGGGRRWPWSFPLSSRNIPEGFQQYSLGSEEHTSELQSLMRISYAVFCLQKQTLHRFPSSLTRLPRQYL